MAKRGRPHKNGVGAFIRSQVIAEAFARARRAGEKYILAIEAAQAAVRQVLPGEPVSDGIVKATLAELQPEGASQVLVVTKVGEYWEFGFGPRPERTSG